MPYRPTPERLKELNAPFKAKLIIQERKKTGWTFALRWWDGKTQRRQILKTQNFQIALKARDYWEEEISSNQRSSIPGTERHTITEFQELYLSDCRSRQLSAKYLQSIKWTFDNLKRVMGDTLIVNVTQDQIQLYMAKELERNRKPRGVSDDLRVIRAAFNWAIEQKWLTINPVTKIKFPKTPRQIPKRLSLTEFKQLVNAIDREDDRNIAIALILTGLRISELLSLTWQDYHMGERYIFIQGKGGHEREIPIGSLLQETLEKTPKYENCDLIFPGRTKTKTGYIPRGKISYSRLRTRFAGYFEKANIQGEGVFHRLRHSFASILADSGHTSLELKQLLGHASTETTEIYTRIGGSRLHETIEALNKGIRLSLRQ